MSIPTASKIVLWPPRRAILVAGILAVGICVAVGTGFTAVALIGGTALAPFLMGHIERKMHHPPRRRGREADHNTDESTETRPHKTTTTTED